MNVTTMMLGICSTIYLLLQVSLLTKLWLMKGKQASRIMPNSLPEFLIHVELEGTMLYNFLTLLVLRALTALALLNLLNSGEECS